MITRKPVRLFLSFGIVAAAAWLGSFVTFPSINGWYAALDKPFFSPPNWVFGPVWTVLYALMAVSLYLIWTARTTRSKRLALGAFGVQLALNVAWSAVFFGLHQPWFAVGVIAALWLMIAVCIALFWPIKRWAAYLLIPYLAWVSFATALNISVAMLNPAPNSASSYADCVKKPGSNILLSYPEICVTPEGQRYTNPDASVDLPLQNSLSIPELGAVVPLSGEAVGAYYRYDKSAKEVYLTTAKLESNLKTITGCTSGLHGLYVGRGGGQLQEQPRVETLCMPADSPESQEIRNIQAALRSAITSATVE